jgi:hypothetical protein
VIASEKTCYPATSKVHSVFGHARNTLNAVYSHVITDPAQFIPGTYVPIAQELHAPGDVAAWVRWSTTQKTSRGKPIYLRNYFHDVYANSTSTHDALSLAQKAALAQHGSNWFNGFNASGLVYHRAGPKGAVAQAPVVESTYLTTRTLHRRGKRKKA